MKITNETKRQFEKSIAQAIEFLNDDESEMSDPCIYAETGGAWRKEMGFYFGPKIHMQDGDILWITVEADSFGEYNQDADPEDEAMFLSELLWDDAIGYVTNKM